MSQICHFCQKKPQKAGKWKKTRSQYNPRQRSKQKPNLQWVRLSSGKRDLACAKCIKALTKPK